MLPLFGNARPVVLPSAGIDAAVDAPLDANRAGERAGRLHDARFDLDLGLRAVERPHELAGGRQPIRQVAHDEGVGAGIHLHFAARRQRAAGEDRDQVRRLGVAERQRQHAELTRERLRVGQLAALFFFLRQHVSGAMRTTVPSTAYPSLFALRMMSSA